MVGDRSQHHLSGTDIVFFNSAAGSGPNYTPGQVLYTQNVAGSYSFTIPSVVNVVQITVWGAGGGGAVGRPGVSAGGGGGGGAYAQCRAATASLGFTVAITVGMHGVADGAAGTETLVVMGSPARDIIASAGANGATGTGGSGGTATVSTSYTNIVTAVGHAGGSAVSPWSGGGAPLAYADQTNVGAIGTTPGGGGVGGSSVNNLQGQNGADGQIIIVYLS